MLLTVQVDLHGPAEAPWVTIGFDAHRFEVLMMLYDSMTGAALILGFHWKSTEDERPARLSRNLRIKRQVAQTAAAGRPQRRLPTLLFHHFQNVDSSRTPDATISILLVLWYVSTSGHDFNLDDFFCII